jgi:hypothetical protein
MHRQIPSAGRRSSEYSPHGNVRFSLLQLQQCFRGNFMKGKWLLQLSSKSLLSMNIQVMPHARSHAAVAMAERVAASGIGSLRKTDGLCLCAELPRHPLDHDGGPCAAEAGRPVHSRPSALQAYLKPPRASAPSGALCTVSNPHARCELRFPDLRALSLAIGQHSGWDS